MDVGLAVIVNLLQPSPSHRAPSTSNGEAAGANKHLILQIFSFIHLHDNLGFC